MDRRGIVDDGFNENENDFEQEPREPIHEVVIDGLAALKIIKHCDDNIPTMVAGSLLGLDSNGVLEISYSYPFIGTKSSSDADEVDGSDYQEQMMKMLEDVGVDNNCVGWYQSSYLETLFTPDIVEYQYNYQTSDMLSSNTVVIIYDPFQSKQSKPVLKAFRLSDRYMEIRRSGSKEFIKPSDILQELPLRFKNVGHSSAFLRCLQDSHQVALDRDFRPLSLASSDTFTEKNLELLGTYLDDLVQEQQRFIMYSKQVAKPRQDRMKWLRKMQRENAELIEAGRTPHSTNFDGRDFRPLPEVPTRTDTLLTLGQLERYTDQLNTHVDASLHQLVVTSQIN